MFKAPPPPKPSSHPVKLVSSKTSNTHLVNYISFNSLRSVLSAQNIKIISHVFDDPVMS